MVTNEPGAAGDEKSHESPQLQVTESGTDPADWVATRRAMIVPTPLDQPSRWHGRLC
jgi:hypothetical protein